MFVELEDHTLLTFVAITPLNLITLMDNEGVNYISAGPPFIIVKKLNEECIRQAIENHAENDAFWLKLFFIASDNANHFDMNQLNSILKKIKQTNDEIVNG
ncbi:hypothetical protein ACE3MZ_21195 [Paenibacillus sp. WLX1005]|uniref:hypothetical protein n=1 Tax=Paenibacillus sp. WLX1005 TaxID=3243766 RepID=UPI003983E858